MLHNLLKVQDMASRQGGSPAWVCPVPKHIASHYTLYYPVILALKNMFNSVYRNDLKHILWLFININVLPFLLA